MTDSHNQIEELPAGWIRATFIQCCDKVQDGSHFSPQVQYAEAGTDRYLYITAKNIKENSVDLSNITWVDRDFHDSIFCRCNPEKGDVLLIKDGVKTGRATVNQLEQPFSLLSSVALLKVKKELLNSHFLKHYLNSPTGFKTTTRAMTGTAIRRIILAKLKTSTIPIPPLPEQHRIVSKIEELFTKLDAGVDELKRAKAQLRRYRQAILNAALEGELTKQWREDNKGNTEPVQALLVRIEEFRNKHEIRKRVKHTVEVDQSTFPELPKGWTWTNWDQIGFSQNGRSFPSKDYSEQGVKLLRPGNLHANGMVIWNESNTRFLPTDYEKDNPTYTLNG
jgi:type I restriction enzyme, S subunit